VKSAPRELRLGTRGSQLALWQANAVATRIAERGGPPCRIVVIRTSGDTLADRPLSEAGGKRLFVKEIEDALLRDEVDLAVHSSKDMPALLPEGLIIAGVLPREDPFDAVVLPAGTGADGPAGGTTSSESLGVPDLIARLGPAPNIGTSSVRRVAQLSSLLIGARFGPIRGNLDTRLRKLDAGDHDAIVLAAAGLRRLGMASRITMTLPAQACVPAPGQGIVAIEVRAGDEAVGHVVARIDDADAAAALTAERALVEALGGGCQTPIGALATRTGVDAIEVIAAVAALDGRRILRTSAQGSAREAAAVGIRAARQLLAQGAGVILAEAQTRA
jgi:hydroxymethylbilane synthase